MTQEKNWEGKVISDSEEATTFDNETTAKQLSDAQFLAFLARSPKTESLNSKDARDKEKITNLFELFQEQKEAVKTISEVLVDDINLIYQTDIKEEATKGISEYLETMIIEDTDQFIKLAELAKTYTEKRKEVTKEEADLKEVLKKAKIESPDLSKDQETTPGVKKSWWNYAGHKWLAVKRLTFQGKGEQTKNEAIADLESSRETFLEARGALRDIATQITELKEVVGTAVREELIDVFEGKKTNKDINTFMRAQNTLDAINNRENDIFNVSSMIEDDTTGINNGAKKLVDKAVQEVMNKTSNFDSLESLEVTLRPILQAEKVGDENMRPFLRETFEKKTEEINKQIESIATQASPDKKVLADLRKKAILFSFIAKNYPL